MSFLSLSERLPLPTGTRNTSTPASGYEAIRVLSSNASASGDATEPTERLIERPLRVRTAISSLLSWKSDVGSFLPPKLTFNMITPPYVNEKFVRLCLDCIKLDHPALLASRMLRAMSLVANKTTNTQSCEQY
jgi:hypothetical protein